MFQLSAMEMAVGIKIVLVTIHGSSITIIIIQVIITGTLIIIIMLVGNIST